ncbi:MAG TPA: hypothetical protein ENN76_00035 [Euryarchaeota archaeon]|nr:hypothetical protein [Euryarchaeota archaeon]
MKEGGLFATRNLVVMAMLCALGGVLSMYIGYLGNLVNRAVGVPFGAGQFMAGLHVFWIVLAYALVKKTGSSTIVGGLKGVVEMLVGSTHGFPIIIVSLIQGMVFEAVMFFTGGKGKRAPLYLGAGLSAASNIFVFQFLYLSSVPIHYIAIISLISFASGVIFGGHFGWSMVDTLKRSGVVRGFHSTPEEKKGLRAIFTPSGVFATVLAFGLVVGGAYYYLDIYTPLPDSPSCIVTGDVGNEYIYRPEAFEDNQTTVRAELVGSVTHVPAKNYTGVPLRDIVSRANPSAGARTVKVVASDGYYALFELDEVRSDGGILLIVEGNTLRLVANNYEGAYWVKEVVEVKVS